MTGPYCYMGHVTVHNVCVCPFSLLNQLHAPQPCFCFDIELSICYVTLKTSFILMSHEYKRNGYYLICCYTLSHQKLHKKYKNLFLYGELPLLSIHVTCLQTILPITVKNALHIHLVMCSNYLCHSALTQYFVGSSVLYSLYNY